jgi:hypothetical protein
MGHAYKAVQWTPYKRSFDVALAVGVAAFVGAFIRPRPWPRLVNNR